VERSEKFGGWAPLIERLWAADSVLARFARALCSAIKKSHGAHTFSPREKVPRRGG
jgi:hypothetical protein